MIGALFFMLRRSVIAFGLISALGWTLAAQVYSPKVLRAGQPDSTDLKKFAAAIYGQAHAQTPREKAEAIWRFFLTDGRFVKPGFWYHIAGWAYEEPAGEVLDPMKLLNSYGFGLCYHIAPLLEAVYEAGGFEDARVWFLTGHTVTEVFYDGAYHYFDSDMMGYNVAGEGSFRGKPVACVRQLEQDPDIMIGKLASPKQTKDGTVDYPWYPADVRAAAIPDLANLFTTTNDNRLFPYTRYSTGNSMDFTLRPGEKLIRYFRPEEPGLFYLPYKFDGKQWSEFPQEIAAYRIRTEDGPRSQKDKRTWATGRIEYAPPKIGGERALIFDMPSPYVIMDARFRMHALMASAASSVSIATSRDGGATWDDAGELHGPYDGDWSVEPAVIVKTEHGRWTAVSGSYGYKVRITRNGPPAGIEGLNLTTRVQLNPRTLPAIASGENQMIYTSGAPVTRIAVPVSLDRVHARDLDLITESGQSFLEPARGQTGVATFELAANGRALTGFDAGARFLDLRDGLAPDKLTAEVRHTAVRSSAGAASIEWSLSPDGPFHPLWSYPKKLVWRDGEKIDRLLLWPEAFEQVRDVPRGSKRVYVRFRTSGPSIDNIRLAVYAAAAPPAGQLQITHVWKENGARREFVERIDAADGERRYNVPAGPNVENEAVVLELSQVLLRPGIIASISPEDTIPPPGRAQVVLRRRKPRQAGR